MMCRTELEAWKLDMKLLVLSRKNRRRGSDDEYLWVCKIKDMCHRIASYSFVSILNPIN